MATPKNASYKETLDDFFELDEKVSTLSQVFEVFESQVSDIFASRESQLDCPKASENQLISTRSSDGSFAPLEKLDNETKSHDIIPSIHETLRKIAYKAELLNARLATLERFVKRPNNRNERHDKKKVYFKVEDLNLNGFVREIHLQKQEMNEIMLNWSEYVARFQSLVRKVQFNSRKNMNYLDKTKRNNSEKGVQVNFDRTLNSKSSMLQRSRSLLRSIFKRGFRKKLPGNVTDNNLSLRAICSKRAPNQFILDTAINEFIKHYETLGIRFRPFLLPMFELKSLLSSRNILELCDKSTETEDEEFDQKKELRTKCTARKWKKLIF